MTVTDRRTSLIHCCAPPSRPLSAPLALLSNVPRSSMRFWTTLLGATPAKPSSTARIIERPCLLNSWFLWMINSSVREERLMRLDYMILFSQQNEFMINHLQGKCKQRLENTALAKKVILSRNIEEHLGDLVTENRSYQWDLGQSTRHASWPRRVSEPVDSPDPCSQKTLEQCLDSSKDQSGCYPCATKTVLTLSIALSTLR